jgi:iron complex transport system ATP-binding protein
VGLMPGIIASDISVSIDGKVVLDSISIHVAPGELIALVGPNGAGKSTLLSVLSGDIRPTSGTVSIDDREISSYKAIELARMRSVLIQENQMSFPFTVGQVVIMGRSPWARTPAFEGDEIAVAEAMVEMDVDQLVTRRFTALSGGEKARVSLARVLAQRTPTVLLDEPTASLDLSHQEDVMRSVQALAAAGRAVLVVVHDLTLAAAYADRIALLSAGRLVSSGTPAEVLTVDRVAKVYGLEVDVSMKNGRPIVQPVRAVGGGKLTP